MYKITESGRGRVHERRVELTSTYGHGLEPDAGFTDVVLGFDPKTKVFVGLDPVRLRHGGETSNASSFLEAGGLRRTKTSPFVVLLRPTKIFPEGEHQAFFLPECLGEYLYNFTAIHSGGYAVTGVGEFNSLGVRWYAKPIGTVAASRAQGDMLVLTRRTDVARRTTRLTVQALKLVDETAQALRRQLTPEEFRAIQQRQEQNGVLGEQFVFDRERQLLRQAGRPRLAEQVDWISRRSIGEGYDIRSFEPKSGRPRFIEVKSCEQSTSTFDTSANEWARADELGAQYCIYRVINVRDIPRIEILQDPVRLQRIGKLRLSPTNWRVKILR